MKENMDYLKVTTIKHIRQTYIVPLDDSEYTDIFARIENSEIPIDSLEEAAYPIEVISEDIVSIMAG